MLLNLLKVSKRLLRKPFKIFYEYLTNSSQ
nr:MAG TPA: hypothetical protein [Bacteriophage sp.]